MLRIALVILMVGALGGGAVPPQKTDAARVGPRIGVRHAAAAHAGRAQNPSGGEDYKALSSPTSGEEYLFRRLERQQAQARSDAFFAALKALLGGSAPGLNFVPSGSALVRGGGMSTRPQRSPDIAIDPLATYSLIDDQAPRHSSTVNGLAHEDAHLRQLLSVLASLPTSEGGAQAFADLVAQDAAQRAKIPYLPGNYDYDYADCVKQVNAQRGRDWILAGQFGKAGSPTWP